jgi:hypothetical protein
MQDVSQKHVFAQQPWKRLHLKVLAFQCDNGLARLSLEPGKSDAISQWLMK